MDLGAATLTREHIHIDRLLLDGDNYRFAVDENESDQREFTQEEIRRRLNRHHGVKELQESILSNGWLPVDLIAVTQSRRQLGSYDIIEGNRRVAALKNIMEDIRVGRALEIPGSVERACEGGIDVMVVGGSAEDIRAWSRRLMGIRHVSGPKEWSGYQAARLIDEMFREGSSLATISKPLGISTIDAGRRLRGYRAFHKMQQNFTGGRMKANYYTLLLEAISAPSIRKWIGWDEESLTFADGPALTIFYNLIAGSSPTFLNPQQIRDFKTKLDGDAEFGKILLEVGDIGEAERRASERHLSGTSRPSNRREETNSRSIPNQRTEGESGRNEPKHQSPDDSVECKLDEDALKSFLATLKSVSARQPGGVTQLFRQILVEVQRLIQLGGE